MIIDNVRTHELSTIADVRKASVLTEKYCMYQIKGSDINQQLKSERWTRGYLLSDLILNVKDKDDKGSRQPVAFVLFVDGVVQKKPSKVYCHPLGVRWFAMEPWYNYETAVKWIKYLYMELIRERKDITHLYWPVDEYDTPLQVALKEEGFKYKRTYQSSVEASFNIKGSDETIAKMLFTLE